LLDVGQPGEGGRQVGHVAELAEHAGRPLVVGRRRGEVAGPEVREAEVVQRVAPVQADAGLVADAQCPLAVLERLGLLAEPAEDRPDDDLGAGRLGLARSGLACSGLGRAGRTIPRWPATLRAAARGRPAARSTTRTPAS
jgi:hypothetical protein